MAIPVETDPTAYLSSGEIIDLVPLSYPVISVGTGAKEVDATSAFQAIANLSLDQAFFVWTEDPLTIPGEDGVLLTNGTFTYTLTCSLAEAKETVFSEVDFFAADQSPGGIVYGYPDNVIPTELSGIPQEYPVYTDESTFLSEGIGVGWSRINQTSGPDTTHNVVALQLPEMPADFPFANVTSALLDLGDDLTVDVIPSNGSIFLRIFLGTEGLGPDSGPDWTQVEYAAITALTGTGNLSPTVMDPVVDITSLIATMAADGDRTRSLFFLLVFSDPTGESNFTINGFRNMKPTLTVNYSIPSLG
jgi:hypothetical protein